MAQESVKLRAGNEPSTLAKIIMEVEPLSEKEKLVMLKQVRMRKALFMTEKLKEAIKPNKINLEEIVAEQKKMHIERNKNASK